MRLEIDTLDCIGGMRPLDGGSPFDSASVVVADRSAPDRIARISRYEDPSHAVGEALTPDEWRALRAAGHAHKLPKAVPLRSGARMWLLSGAFEGRRVALSDLRAAGVLLDLQHDAASDTDIALVREMDANVLRDGWAKHAFGQAKEWAQRGKWERALSLAEQAWVLGRGPVAEHWALLALCYERVGRGKRAEGMAKVAKRSHGEVMARDMAELRKGLEVELDSGSRQSRFAAIRHEAKSSHRAALAGLGPKVAA